jgi:hypothetical protein
MYTEEIADEVDDHFRKCSYNFHVADVTLQRN